MYQVLVTRMLNLRMHCLAPSSNLRHKPRMRIAQQKIDHSVTQCTFSKQRKRPSQIKTAKEIFPNKDSERTVEQELEWRKVERAKNTPPPMLAASQEGSTRKDWWKRAGQMKGKQCVVTPQNYYWMSKKKITTEKVKK